MFRRKTHLRIVAVLCLWIICVFIWGDKLTLSHSAGNQIPDVVRHDSDITNTEKHSDYRFNPDGDYSNIGRLYALTDEAVRDAESYFGYLTSRQNESQTPRDAALDDPKSLFYSMDLESVEKQAIAGVRGPKNNNF